MLNAQNKAPLSLLLWTVSLLLWTVGYRLTPSHESSVWPDLMASSGESLTCRKALGGSR